MTTIIDPLANEIECCLEHEPELIFFTWKVQVQNLAANKETLVDPSGLLTVVLDQTEWDAHIANRLVAADGSVAVAPRPTEPVQNPLTAATICDTDIAVKPVGGGPMVEASVGPRDRMMSAFKSDLAACHIAWQSLLYVATEICAFVIPLVMGMCTGSVGRGATPTDPSAPTRRFAMWASHSA